MRATYLEIYQEEVRDLLSKNPNQRLDVKETPDKGVFVKGLVQFVVKSVAEINSVLQVPWLTCHSYACHTTRSVRCITTTMHTDVAARHIRYACHHQVCHHMLHHSLTTCQTMSHTI